MGLVGKTIGALVGVAVIVVILIVLAVIALTFAAYTMAQIDNSQDDPGYGCSWKDSESLSSLHAKLAWTISLSAIFIVVAILGLIGLGVLAFLSVPESGTVAAVAGTAALASAI